MRFQYRQHIRLMERALRADRREHAGNKREVLGGIHGPAQGTLIDFLRAPADAEPLGTPVQEWRDMFPFDGVPRFAIGGRQSGRGEHLGITAQRIRARERVGGVIDRRPFAVPPDYGLDDPGIDQRTVAAHADDRIGPVRLGRFGVAAEDIRFAAAVAGDAALAAEGLHGVVLGIGGGGYHQLVAIPHRGELIEFPGEQGLAGDGQENLSRQPGGSHAGLKDHDAPLREARHARHANMGPIGDDIVITGGSGLLGANLAMEFTRRGHAVTALYGRHPIRMEGVRGLACDLLDSAASAALLARLAPAWIVHCAAATDVDWCESHPRDAMRINADAAGAVAAAAQRVGAGFVHISTDAVFDGVSGGYREDDAPGPVNWYARSKAAGEAAVGRAAPGALIVRANLYGWNLQPKYSLAEWVLSRLERGEAVPGFGDVTFSPVLANQLSAWILRLREAGAAGLYHAASADWCTKYEFARELARVFGLDEALVREAELGASALAAPRPRHTWLRAEKLAAAVGRPLASVREGLEEFRALRENGVDRRLKAAAT